MVIPSFRVFHIYKISLLYFGVETILQEAVVICECTDYSIAEPVYQ